MQTMVDRALGGFGASSSWLDFLGYRAPWRVEADELWIASQVVVSHDSNANVDNGAQRISDDINTQSEMDSLGRAAAGRCG